MESLPFYISFVFILSTFLAVYFFYQATNGSKLFLVLTAAWLTIQTIIALNGFYTETTIIPPRFLLLVMPPLLLMAAIFFTTRGQQYLDTLSIQQLTLLHMVRVPVEVVLYWLFLHKAVPVLMTFEGRNFDILSGISAPLIFYFGFIKKKIHRTLLILWNFLCLFLLFNIVIHAILSAPSPFQQLAFNQPNKAVLYFPFIWLPGFIVPLVLFSHLASLRKLLLINRESTPMCATNKILSNRQAYENL